MSVDSTPRAQLAYTRAILAAPPGDNGPIEFVASQTRANRYAFSLRADGWLLDRFALNPVFLWHHQPEIPPIGRVDVRQTGGQLRARVSFDQADELARTVERKYRDGYLNAVSVGWGFVDAKGAPIQDWWRLSAEEIAGPDVFYDLEEISAVSVPGDPLAVRASQGLGRAGALTADGCATLLGALRLDPVPDRLDTRIARMLPEVLAELAASPTLPGWQPPAYVPPITGGRR